MLELCKAGYANKNNEDYVIEDQQRLARAARGHRGSLRRIPLSQRMFCRYKYYRFSMSFKIRFLYC